MRWASVAQTMLKYLQTVMSGQRTRMVVGQIKDQLGILLDLGSPAVGAVRIDKMIAKDVEDNDGRLRFVMRLLIKHPEFNPKLISEQLGMMPNMTQLAGAKRVAPNGEMAPSPNC